MFRPCPSARRPKAGVALLGAAVLFGGSVVALTATPAHADPAPPRQPGKAEQQFGKKDRSLLAAAQAKGKKQVTLLVAAEPGRAKELAGQLEKLGGQVRKTDTTVDYVRVLMPIGKAYTASKLPGVAAMDVSEVLPLPNPRPGPNGSSASGAVEPTPQTPPSARTPRVNPYMPTRDTGAAQFVLAHPRWDGRGVTIGILDTGVDLGHPALANTTTGERKVTDWTTYTDPVTDGDPTWLKMSTELFPAGHTFTFAGRQWVPPATGGPFSAAVFAESGNDISDPASEVAGDVNRDGDKTDKFGVLQDAVSKAVYVDADDNQKFTDNRPMQDYKVKYDVGTFGTDNPATPVREAMPFVVQTNVPGWVNIGIASGAHGSHVAGIATADRMFGGAMAGAAPGAKVKSFRVCLFSPACTDYALTEGMIAAARSGVDVMNMSIGGLPPLNDGNNARAELYNRLIRDFHVQLVISAGNNGAGLNTVGDPSVATDVLSVGSYIHNDTWKSNYGSSSPQTDNLHPFSSRGPREDGGFKPEIVAPGSAVSTVPTWEAGQPVAGTYTLPPGYAMFNGTSMASPQATGAVALLVSAYKATHHGSRPQPSALRNAVISTARHLPGYGAHEQGAGLVRVARAWDQLDRDGRTDTVTTSVEVSSALSGFLTPPNRGTGIYDREGVAPGASYTRTYTLTRRTGASGPVAYSVSWLGNDGTYSAPRTVSLARGQATAFAVRVTPATAGVHSAVLQLDNPATPGIDAHTLNTVVAAEKFTAGNGYSVTKTGTVGRNQATSFFFAVPAGTPALTVDLVGGGAPGKGQLRFLRYHPYGTQLEDNSSRACYNPPVDGGSCPGSPTSRTVTDPFPGVWEVVVEARRTSDVLVAPFSVTASLLGAAVSPDSARITTPIGTPADQQFTFTTRFGAFTGKAVGTTLGSARIARPTITQGVTQSYPVTVPAGAESIRATIGNTSDRGADLDLVVYDCSTGQCTPAGSSADGDSEESVTIANPAAGAWRVDVIGFTVPAGSTQYDYVDVATAPSFGEITVNDPEAAHPTGSTWNAVARVTPRAQAGTDRVLYGQVLVKTQDGVTVGTGNVIVTPG